MTKLVIDPSKKQSKINKEIYGHFSEHLGRCIYEGIYVGEDLPDSEQERNAYRRSRSTEAYQDSGTSLAGWMFRR